MDKRYYDVYDIMRIFDVSRSKAYDILAEIKVVSCILKVAGKVAVTDFEAWYNSPIRRNISVQEKKTDVLV